MGSAEEAERGKLGGNYVNKSDAWMWHGSEAIILAEDREGWMPYMHVSSVVTDRTETEVEL